MVNLVVRANTASGLFTQSNSAALDWTRRSTGDGVVKAVHFPTATNVNNWRFNNNQPGGWDPTSAATDSNLVRWVADEGIISGTGCLRCESSTSGGTPACWWLNFDPAVTSGNTTESYVIPANTAVFLQVSVRMNTARLTNFGNGATGLKIFEVNNAVRTLLNQGCHVMRSGGRRYVQISNTAAGQTGNESFYWPYVVAGSDYNMQPGSEYGTCLYSGGTAPAGCWIIPADEWCTYLLEYIPGTAATQNTMVRLWVQGPNDTDYVQIYERQDNYITSFQDAGGISAVSLWNRDELSTGLPAGCYHDFDQVIVSRKWIPPRNRTNPTWVDALGIKVWGQPVSSNLNAQKPSPLPPTGPSGSGGFETITVWSGGWLDQIRKRAGIWGGGHAAYQGNEHYAYRLNQNSPSVQRLNNPTPTAQLNYDNATYDDGRPITCHSGDHILCDEFGNFWSLGQGRTEAVNGGGISFNNIWKWIPSPVDTWSTRGTLSATLMQVASSSRFEYSSTAICQETGKMYITSQLGTTNEVNPSTGTATEIHAPDAWPDGDAGGWERTSCVWNTPAGGRVLMVFRSNGTSKIYLLNLDNPSSGWSARTPSNIPSGIFTGIGVSWHRGSNAVLAWGHTTNRQNLLKLSPSNTNPADYTAVLACTWAWSSVTPISGSTVPSNPRGEQYIDTTGTYKRAGIIENIGYISESSASIDAFVILNDVDESPYVFLIPSTGV